jgi:hypothetical protein
MRHDADDDLRGIFAAARRDEASAAPPFDATLAAAKARRSRLGERLVSRRFALAAAATLFAFVAGLHAIPRDNATRADAYGCPRLGSWQAPTDSLLVLPGREVLGQVPDLHPEIPRYVLPTDQPATQLDGG